MTLALVILKLIIMIVVPVAVAVLSYVTKKYFDKLINRIDDNKIRTKLHDIECAIDKIVQEVQQTYVDELKKTNSFNLEEQKTAFNKAKDKAYEMLNDEAIVAIAHTYGNIDAYISTLIESAVSYLK